MNSVYLVLAHRNFQQTSRLVRRLLLGDAGVVLHVDSRTSVPSNFLADCSGMGRVFLTEERFATQWGSFELVLATMALIKEGIRCFSSARYFSLLSAQDYPIKSPEFLDSFFKTKTGNFVGYDPIAREVWQYGGLRRINRYYWAKNKKSLPGFILRTIPLPPRRFPIPTDKVFVGPQWWSFEGSTVAEILNFTKQNPDVLEAFRWAYIPDELYFHTIVLGFLQEPNVVNDHLRYIQQYSLPRDYLRLKILNRNGPKNLDETDLDKLRASPALFARKFDATTSPNILDQVERL